MTDVELFADTLLLMFMMMASILLMHVDPLLPLLWGLVTFVMSLRRTA